MHRKDFERQQCPVRSTWLTLLLCLSGIAFVGCSPGENITRNASLLVDDTRLLSADSAWKTLSSKGNGVVQISEDRVSLGFTKATVWVYVVRNPHARAFLEVDVATIDRIELYTREGPVSRAGDLVPRQEQAVLYRTPMFALPPESEFLLRIENQGPMKFSLIERDEDQLRLHASLDHLWLGIYYGVMITGFLYNLLLSGRFRDATYLSYVAYVAAIGFYQVVISGHFSLFLLPSHPEIGNRLPGIVSNLAFASGVIFTVQFLRLDRLAPPLHRLLKLLVGISIALIPLVLYVGHEASMLKAVNLFGVIVVLTIIGSGMYAYIRGYRPARFFLFGWSVLLLGVFVQIMANLGIFQMTAEQAGQLGSAGEVILLALALADRKEFEQSLERAEHKGHFDRTRIDADPQPAEARLARPLFVLLQTHHRLTYQEARLCELLRNGVPRSEIARQMGISANTLKKHLANIYEKTINIEGAAAAPPQEKLLRLSVFLQEIEKKGTTNA